MRTAPGLSHLLLLLVCTLALSAQVSRAADTKDSASHEWKHSHVAQLTVTQVSYTDWSAGGENALAYTLTADGKSEHDLEKTNWATTYKFAFGQARLGDKGIRKTDDIINLESVYKYKLGVLVNPFISVTALSQFTKGYKFDPSNIGTEVSDLFDPLYLTEAAGVAYQPIPELKTRLGLALREVFVKTHYEYTDDPATTEIEKSKTEGGLQCVTEVNWPINDQVVYTSKLDLFDAFKKLDRVSVRWDNVIAAKLSKVFSINFSLNLINEPTVTPVTQVREAFALGISYTLL
jgi:hypothetical protein